MESLEHEPVVRMRPTMTDQTLSERAPEPAGPVTRDPVPRGWLGHPLAYIATALVLLTLFGATFVLHPDRTAPTRDPAFYTWRIEALMTEEPVRLVEIEGALSMFAVGYRVAAPIIGGFLRHIPGVSLLNSTSFLMVGLPVIIALLMGGFAYRRLRDPLAFHVVALTTGSLLLTQPFVGYLDNVLCIFFLVAALFFIDGVRVAWRARIGFFTFLLLAGMSHPTTLAAFCLTLGVMAGLRLLLRRFDLRSVIRDDGPLLATGAAAAIATFVLWKIGPWGKGASLAESALIPPYGSDFFFDRLVNEWLAAMNPFLNGALLLVGIAGVLALTRRRWSDDSFTLLSIAWLTPLVGVFGFVAGKAYPYYRFFNITPVWVLLCGLGAFFIVRFALVYATRGGIARLALVAIVGVAAIVVTNFMTRLPTWTDPERGWLSDSERTEMDTLRAALESSGDTDRPVVFVIDDRPPKPFQIWAFAKLSGNTSRHGLPDGQIDRGYLYLGSLENYLAGEVTTFGEETYDKISPAILEDAEKGIEEAGKEPIVVLASVFNAAGENVELAAGDTELPSSDADILVVNGNEVTSAAGEEQPLAPEESDPSPIIRTILGLLGLAILALPGWLALRWFVPDATFPETLGLVPALSTAILVPVTFVVLAAVRSPFEPLVAWACVILSIGLGAFLGLRARRYPVAEPAS